MPYDLSAFDGPQNDPGEAIRARLAQALASERGAEQPAGPLEGAMGKSRQYFPALAAISGMQQAPPPAQFEGGDHLRRNMPTPRRVGIGESISNALLPQRDEQGVPQPAGIRDAINAALWVLPGMRGPRGAVMAAEKGAGSGGGPAVSQRILDAYKELGGGGDSVRLHNLRARLSDVPRAELDQALLEMQKSGKANLMHLDNPRDIKAVGDAALKGPSDNYHALWLERPSAGNVQPAAATPATAVPTPATPPAVGITDHVARLKGALGKEEFGPIMQELRNDKTLTQAQAIEIANKFWGIDGMLPKSTSRTKALDRVNYRHKTLMDFKTETPPYEAQPSVAEPAPTEHKGGVSGWLKGFLK